MNKQENQSALSLKRMSMFQEENKNINSFKIKKKTQKAFSSNKQQVAWV